MQIRAMWFAALLFLLPGAVAATQHAQGLTDGEVRKVDKAAKKITIKHAPIPTLDMPAMTMAFPVKEPALLESVKAGDKVRFEAQKVGDTVTVTRIEKAK